MRHALDDVAEASPQAQDLHLLDASCLQAGEQRRVGPPQMELGFHPPPHRLMVGRVSPGRAHLGDSPFVFHIQITEYDGQDLREKARYVRLGFKHDCGCPAWSRAGGNSVLNLLAQTAVEVANGLTIAT